MKIAIDYPHSVIPVPRVQIFDALAIVAYEISKRLAHGQSVTARRAPGEGITDRHEDVTFRRMPVAVDRGPGPA